jgi:type IV pili sensor histidine kinase/response regulator
MSKTSVAQALMTVATGLVLSGAAFASAVADPESVRVARYTERVGAETAERDPLAVVASLRFPREVVSNVGDALRYLLQRTGYGLAAADPDTGHLFQLPLPESQRQLGPHPVQVLAQILAGNGYQVCVNPRTRVLTVGATDATSSCEHK